MPLEWLIDIIKEWVISQAYATEAWVLAKFYATEAWVLEWITPANVSGDLAPDGTCTYFKAGTYNGQPYYRRSDGKYFIWWYEGPDYWIISVTLGDAVPGNWYRVSYEMLGNYQPFVPFTGVATVAMGYQIACHAFVDRGDPAAWDWTQANLTRDSTWRDLDLSGIVPAGAKAVLFCILIMDVNINKDFYLRKKGNVNSFNISLLTTQVANIWVKTDAVCPCDDDRFVQYFSNIGLFGQIQICVKGWWL